MCFWAWHCGIWSSGFQAHRPVFSCPLSEDDEAPKPTEPQHPHRDTILHKGEGT